jgi:Inward rectifier potassium channel C-terminal domain/Ion channel
MAIIKRFRSLKSENNSGFGVNSSSSGGRFYDRKRNSANVARRGVSIFDRYSLYHTLLGMPRGKFLLLLLSIYVGINLVFAGIYYLIGIQHLAGINSGSEMQNFSEVFFFSTQTFTTVGYGRISPTGFTTSAVATFEAFLGLLSFAIATGLFYGRFSRPQAFLKFSHNAVIAPFQEASAFMLRMSPYKNNNLSEAEVKLTLFMEIEENGKKINKFYNLDVEISKINSLSLSWTIVHPINDKSPLYGFTETDFKNTRMEAMIFVKAFDEVFSNTVVTRYSYITDEIIWGAKFKMMYHPNEDKSKTILDLDKLNDFELVPLPDAAAIAAGN